MSVAEWELPKEEENVVGMRNIGGTIVFMTFVLGGESLPNVPYPQSSEIAISSNGP